MHSSSLIYLLLIIVIISTYGEIHSGKLLEKLWQIGGSKEFTKKTFVDGLVGATVTFREVSWIDPKPRNLSFLLRKFPAIRYPPQIDVMTSAETICDV